MIMNISHGTKMDKQGSENLKMFSNSEEGIETMVCIF